MKGCIYTWFPPHPATRSWGAGPSLRPGPQDRSGGAQGQNTLCSPAQPRLATERLPPCRRLWLACLDSSPAASPEALRFPSPCVSLLFPLLTFLPGRSLPEERSCSPSSPLLCLYKAFLAPYPRPTPDRRNHSPVTLAARQPSVMEMAGLPVRQVHIQTLRPLPQGLAVHICDAKGNAWGIPWGLRGTEQPAQDEALSGRPLPSCCVHSLPISSTLASRHAERTLCGNTLSNTFCDFLGIRDSAACGVWAGASAGSLGTQGTPGRGEGETGQSSDAHRSWRP